MNLRLKRVALLPSQVLNIIRIGNGLTECQDNVTAWEPAAWFPSGATLKGHRECALSQVGTHPDKTLDVARR